MAKGKKQSRKKGKVNKRLKVSAPNPVVRFLLLFAAGMVLFYIFYKSSFFTNYLEVPIVKAQATMGSGILNVFGEGTHVNGTNIQGEDGFSINIKGGCDGLEATALLLCAICMFPIGFKYKIPGLIVGGIALLILNLIRIAGLYIAGHYASDFVFDLLHEQGGFVIFTALSIVIWMIWAGWAMKKATAEAVVAKS